MARRGAQHKSSRPSSRNSAAPADVAPCAVRLGVWFAILLKERPAERQPFGGLRESVTMAEKSGWHDPSNLIAGIAGLVSLVSLTISVRSCVVSDRSLDLARVEFRSQRSLILSGSVAADGNSIELKAQDPAIALQEARAVFPKALNGQEWFVQPPEHRLHLLVLRSDLQNAVEQRVRREPGKLSVAVDANVPVIVTSLFTAKGESFEDRSLYRIMYSFVVNGDNKALPLIDSRGSSTSSGWTRGPSPRAYLQISGRRALGRNRRRALRQPIRTAAPSSRNQTSGCGSRG